jgi:O-antigen ligase
MRNILIAGQLDDGARSRLAVIALVAVMPLAIEWPLLPAIDPAVPALYAAPALHLSDLALAAVLLCGGIGPRWVESGTLAWPLLALLALALLGVPTALSPALAIYATLRWSLAANLAVALAQLDIDIEGIVRALLIGLCVHALVGLAQVLRQAPLGLPGEMARSAASVGASIVVFGSTRWLRAYGLMLHPNILGGYLAIGLLLALPLLDRRRWRLVWWLLLLGLLLSFSRSAWLVLALTLPPLAGWLAWRQTTLRRPIQITLAGAALIALACGVALAQPLQSRLHPASVAAERRSLRERDEMNAIALDIIWRRPLLGVGAGNFPLAMLVAGTSVAPQYVHHLPLLLAAELGIAGGALWLWLWLVPIALLWRRRHSTDPWLVVLSGAWLALGAIGLWDSYPWGLPSGLLLAMLLLGLLSRALAAANRCGLEIGD